MFDASGTVKASLGLGSAIVRQLKRFGGTLDVDFLAHVTDQPTERVEQYVELLQSQGVVERQDGSVSLKR